MALSYTELELLHDLLDQAIENEQIKFWFGPDTRDMLNLDFITSDGSPYIDLEIA